MFRDLRYALILLALASAQTIARPTTAQAHPVPEMRASETASALDGNAFYGMTEGGGKYGDGTVYEGLPTGTDRVLHSFGAGQDGEFPEGGLVALNGVLYGTTNGGGKYGPGGYGSYGTVFAVTASGTERVLHNFGQGLDGRHPLARLVALNGALYGTTPQGGKYGRGTVFEITTSGIERVLYSFGTALDDGQAPLAGLIAVDGDLYGTTTGGGKYDAGTVFAIATSGKERVLYSFGAKADDGNSPQSGLVDYEGILYGTTYVGGEYGDGSVFQISSGTERVLYSFGATVDDGKLPIAALVVLDGVLYGTTGGGGKYQRPGVGGYGTVFALTRSGAERVLHNFGHGLDGYYPYSSLIAVFGNLYGATFEGGKYQLGAAFEVTRSGSERVLYNFGEGLDGKLPSGALI